MTQLHPGTTAKSLPAFKAVLWDMDGTLVDTEPLHKKSVQMVGDAIGLPVSDELCLKCLGVGYRFCYDTLTGELGEMPVSFDVWQEKVIQAYLQLTAEIETRPQALEAVRHFHALGIPQAIVSNSPRFVVEANAKGFLRFFDNPDGIFRFIVSIDEMKRPKPEPDGYLQAAAEFGVAPSECLVIEDSPTGVRSGMASGCFTIYWPSTHIKPATDLNPSLMMSDWKEIL